MTAELIERLERGETGSMIDRDINGVLGGSAEQWDDYAVRVTIAPVTTSLDAAIALVERMRPGLFWLVAKEHPDFLREGEHLCSASVYGAVEWSSHEGYPEPHIPSSDARAPTPAAALIAALLKAEAK